MCRCRHPSCITETVFPPLTWLDSEWDEICSLPVARNETHDPSGPRAPVSSMRLGPRSRPYHHGTARLRGSPNCSRDSSSAAT
ncbi:hypothetical protein VFPFJ_04698 [Purpureocillium lilacinum]|uniref:Leucinostatins biosynthesis cluster protein M n=1 Tax=Purpureocillium lilacinum TaxID=33203 RepID=LCSM_PURLI|nr:hypothetical protein VFPFJ_04698 [Purpureocillium lilacinum]A0A179HM40.1 RecName: Full=Leucinostatins biosynthesis cluster protein M [Purpureocillium lilacinum]OAQ83759.1 hypothetical protein VFPBJ_02526 [Purpureocillium lilacinum]OAQ90539.1 hypothetical protein VFPFJ_04698 [Purpureocillium lilacinum]